MPGIPRAIDELVLRMLAKAPRDRIGYVEDVATALERLGAPGIALGTIGSIEPPRPRAYTYRPGLAGRTELLSTLDAALLAGRGCVCLVGVSGVGKTRLVAEVATRAIESDMRVVTCECEPHAAPLYPIRPLLRAIADASRDSGPIVPQLSVLAPYEPDVAELVPPLAELPAPTAAARFRVLAVLRDAMAALASIEPLLIVIDDLQWADELTLALLASMGELVAGHRVIVLATARAEELTPEIEATLRALSATRLDIPRLDREAVGAMVRDMLALDDDAPTLTDFVATRSAGNPLFAAEYVRIAVDEGVLHRDVSGRWRLSQRDDDSYNSLPTPGSIRELVRKRLDALSAPAREVALAAAVIGRPASPRLLAQAANITGDLPAIAELVQRHVLEELSDGTLRLVHDTLREQAYAQLAEHERRRRHAAVASSISDDELSFAELAHHFEAAGDLPNACAYLDRAAEHALATAAYGDARDHLRRLLQLSADPDRRAGWERRLGEACYALGDLAGCETHLRSALGRLGIAQPATKLGWAATIARGVGRQLASRVRPPTRVEPALAEAALASGRMTSCYFFADDSLGLVGSALTAINLAERAGGGVAVAEIYAQLGYVAGLAKLGRVAHGYFATARATATATRDPVGMCKAHFSEAAYHVGIGAWPAARTAANAGLAIARELRNPMEAEVAFTILGHVEFATGDYEASRAQAVALAASARARANAQHEAWGIYTQARASLYTGALDDAIARLRPARWTCSRGCRTRPRRSCAAGCSRTRSRAPEI